MNSIYYSIAVVLNCCVQSESRNRVASYYSTHTMWSINDGLSGNLLETSGNLPETSAAGFRIFQLIKKSRNLPETCRKPAAEVSGRFPEVSSRFPDNPSLTDHTVCIRRQIRVCTAIVPTSLDFFEYLLFCFTFCEYTQNES